MYSSTHLKKFHQFWIPPILFLHFYSEVNLSGIFVYYYFVFLCSLSSSLYFYAICCSFFKHVSELHRNESPYTYLPEKWPLCSYTVLFHHTFALPVIHFHLWCPLYTHAIIHLYSLFRLLIAFSYGPLSLLFLYFELNTSPFILFFYSDEN